MSDGSVTIDTNLDNKNVDKDIEGLKGKLEKIRSVAGTAFKGVATAVGAVGTAMTAVGGAALKIGTDYQQASNQLQASTGATSAEMENLKEVMKSVYANNFGEDMNDVANSIASVRKNLGELDNVSLQNATQSAIALRDTFEYDVNESTRSAKALMDNFGVSSEEAFNLITQGAQSGLDYSGELLDNISEYSIQFAKVGLDAEDMFDIFASGAENGAFNLDKIGDAVKEFSIRAIDGSNTTIEGFTKLGLNADEMAQKFAQGGDTAKEAFYQVIQQLGSMDDKVEQSKVGVDLFGTMWEDLGPEVITQLGSMQGAFDKTKNSAEQLTQIKYDDLGSALQGIGRIIQTNVLLPMAESVLPFFNQFANEIKEAFSGENVDTQGIVNAISNLITNLSNKFVESAPQFMQMAMGIIQNLVLGLQQNLPQIVQGAIIIIQTLLNAFLEMLPTILNMGVQFILQLIIGIGQALPELIPKALDCVLTIVEGLLENIDLLVDAAIQLIMGLADGLINAIPVLLEKAPIIIEKLLNALITNAPKILQAGIELIFKLAQGIIESLPKIVESAGNIIQTIWNTLKELPGKALQWGKDMIQGFIDGIKGMMGSVGSAIKGVGSKIASFLHFSRPDEGPLRNYEKWMPDMAKGLTKTLYSSAPQLYNATREIANKMAKNLDLSNIYSRMENAVLLQNATLSANLATTATTNRIITANITMQPSNVYMDSSKVGRIVTPSVSKTLKSGGLR